MSKKHRKATRLPGMAEIETKSLCLFDDTWSNLNEIKQKIGNKELIYSCVRILCNSIILDYLH
jgi:hypothetical protein